MSISVETLALAKKAGPNVEEINGLKEQINNFYFGYDADRNPGYSTDGKNFFPFKSSVARAFVNISDCICLDVTGFTHLTLLSILEKSEQTTGCYIYANDVYSTKIIYESLVNITEDGKAEGCLAKEWETTDNLTYIVKLKTGIKCYISS